MPTCAKGKSTIFLTLRYNLNNNWKELDPFPFEDSWDTCKDACPPDKKYEEGKCLSVKYVKPKNTVKGKFTYLTTTVEYELSKEEVVEETVCEYECKPKEVGRHKEVEKF